MKILVITDLYPIKDDEIYTPKTILNFVNEWENAGHEVKIIKPNFILNSFLRKKPFYKSGIYGNVENINYWLPFLGKIQNKLKTPLKYDIALAHMPSGIIFANKLKLNFCAAVHNSDIEVLTNPIYSVYFKNELYKAYKNAKKIACRSFVLKDKFLKLYPEFNEKTFVAPSGVNTDIIKREWNPKDRIRVLTCGQFIDRKNIDKVIQACEFFPNIELTVIGSGKNEKELRKISSKPIFTGQIVHDEVMKKMRESDIFILPSVNETFGMVYLEAMAMGCITVCTKGDGVDGIIKDGENGFLTSPTVDGIKRTIKNIINFNDKNGLLLNTYNTISEYTAPKTSLNYIKLTGI